LSVYDAIFVDKLTRQQLTEHLAEFLGLSTTQLANVFTRGPAHINVDVTDNVSLLQPFILLARFRVIEIIKTIIRYFVHLKFTLREDSNFRK